jgi:hypothetical protein
MNLHLAAYLHPPTLPSSHLALISLLLSNVVVPSLILLIHSLTSFSLAFGVPPAPLSPASPSKKLSCIALTRFSCSLIAETRRWYMALGPQGDRALSISDCLRRHCVESVVCWSRSCWVWARRASSCDSNWVRCWAADMFASRAERSGCNDDAWEG